MNSTSKQKILDLASKGVPIVSINRLTDATITEIIEVCNEIKKPLTKKHEIR